VLSAAADAGALLFDTGRDSGQGLMFWLLLKKLSGSYLRLTSISRSRFA
jgi:hypothetical protein